MASQDDPAETKRHETPRLHALFSAQVPDLSAAQARALFSAGWRDAGALALAEHPDVAKALVATLPGSMRGKRSANGRAKANEVRRALPAGIAGIAPMCPEQLGPLQG